MPAEATDLFSGAAMSRGFAEPRLIQELTGTTHDRLPRYVSRLGGAVVLAGHDVGEQALLPKALDLLAQSSDPTSFVVIAGGNFHLPGTQDALLQRGRFYRQLSWAPEVLLRTSAQERTSTYLGLHLRATDRSREAPTHRALQQAVEVLSAREMERSIFITADTEEGLTMWMNHCRTVGLEPWSLPERNRERSEVAAMVDAAADWLVLSGALASVFPAASTFSREASLASGRPELSIEVSAPPALRVLRQMSRSARNFVGYPGRRWADHA